MMRPEEIAIALLRRWWVILIAAAVAAGVAYAGTASQEKTYVVSTRIMAIAEPPDYWMDLYAKNRLASYRDLINNWEFVSFALEEAGSDIDPGLAQSKLALGHNPDSNIVQIVVTDTDPVRAAEIANALADGFVSRNDAENDRIVARQTSMQNQYPGRVNMEKLETPSAPEHPSGPRVRVNTIAGGVLGAVAGVLLAFGFVYFDDTLKSRRDLERYLDWPVIGTIPPDIES
jgi:capsular polysaccharide biosynthesis protein